MAVPGSKLTTFSTWTTSRFYNYDLASVIFGFSVDPLDVPQQVEDIFYITANSRSVNQFLQMSSRAISRDLQIKREEFLGRYLEPTSKTMSQL